LFQLLVLKVGASVKAGRCAAFDETTGWAIVNRQGMTPVKIMRLANGENLPLPTYETPGAAGMDLRAAEDMVLKPGARFLMPTGFAIALPDHHEAQVRLRSGLAVKHGVTVLNAPGTIDRIIAAKSKCL
jgi:dUTP pyrophosphatase